MTGQARLLAEAEEHYDLIREITQTNCLGYPQWLTDMNQLKASTRQALTRSPEWGLIARLVANRGEPIAQ